MQTFSILTFVCFVCFLVLRPKSIAMVMAGRSVHLATLFPGQACFHLNYIALSGYTRFEIRDKNYT